MRLLRFLITVNRDSLRLAFAKLFLNVLVLYIRAVIGQNLSIADWSYPFLFGTDYLQCLRGI